MNNPIFEGVLLRKENIFTLVKVNNTYSSTIFFLFFELVLVDEPWKTYEMALVVQVWSIFLFLLIRSISPISIDMGLSSHCNCSLLSLSFSFFLSFFQKVFLSSMWFFFGESPSWEYLSHSLFSPLSFCWGPLSHFFEFWISTLLLCEWLCITFSFALESGCQGHPLIHHSIAFPRQWVLLHFFFFFFFCLAFIFFWHGH